MKTTTSPRNSVVQATLYAQIKTKTESVSDEEKSEKRYSSSGYYESPHDDGMFNQSKNVSISHEIAIYFKFNSIFL